MTEAIPQGQHPLEATGHDNSYFKFSSVPGFFMQDDESTDAGNFSYTEQNLGLIDRSYPTDKKFDPNGDKTQWERFENYVESLNQSSPGNERFKVFYLGRHGEGDHNVAESFYGTEKWDCYWSKLEGNGTITWTDAHLTEKGISQALVANSFWKTHLATAGIPAPQSYYTSPLGRCCSTAHLTFSGLDLPSDRPFIPTVKELLREVIGEHTCDRRSTKSWIHENFPSYQFDADFSEDDTLWVADARESDGAHEVRMGTLLGDIFANDRNTWISFSTHSGSIAAILRAISHRKFSLATGAVIPVLIKAERILGVPPSTTIEPWLPTSSCSSTAGVSTSASATNLGKTPVATPASATESAPA